MLMQSATFNLRCLWDPFRPALTQYLLNQCVCGLTQCWLRFQWYKVCPNWFAQTYTSLVTFQLTWMVERRLIVVRCLFQIWKYVFEMVLEFCVTIPFNFIHEQVRTVDGTSDLRIPPGTQPGDVIVLAKQGVPSLNKPSIRGDHLFTVKVAIPKRIRWKLCFLTWSYLLNTFTTILELASHIICQTVFLNY